MQYARTALATTSRLERWSVLGIAPQSLPCIYGSFNWKIPIVTISKYAGRTTPITEDADLNHSKRPNAFDESW